MRIWESNGSYRDIGSFLVIKYLFYLVFDLLFRLQCYITNPIVVLFADEKGNLPKYLQWWQTYDNCLDIQWMITEGIVPKLFRYDFNKHYVYTPEYKDNGEMVPGHVLIIDPVFTKWELVQRYFCRLAWLYRNTGYGFSYNITGCTYNTSNNIRTEQRYFDIGKTIEFRHILNSKDNLLAYKRAIIWVLPYLNKKFKLDIYLGWKLQEYTKPYNLRAMLAFRISPFRSVKG